MADHGCMQTDDDTAAAAFTFAFTKLCSSSLSVCVPRSSYYAVVIVNLIVQCEIKQKYYVCVCAYWRTM